MNFEVCSLNGLNHNTCTNPTKNIFVACIALLSVQPCVCSTSPPGGKVFAWLTFAKACGNDKRHSPRNQSRENQRERLGNCVWLSNSDCRASMHVFHATRNATHLYSVQESQYHRHIANNTSHPWFLSTNGQNMPWIGLQSIGKDSCRLAHRLEQDICPYQTPHMTKKRGSLL